MAKQKQFAKTGIYMRLSRDDEKAGESMSIENQRVILQKYVVEKGGTIIDEYVDDGWSGTDFNRPGITRMLDDAQSGKIDTIVVKDLSRFGRNYIQVGQYIDYIFPAYGIRFVALSDNIDTADRGSTAMDMMPIMNVFNEWHAANTSKKIRAVQSANQRAGKYTNWNYPYGYKAGTDEFRTAVIDEEAAKVVRRIYEMRAQGYSTRKIIRTLTDEGIPNPTNHFTSLEGKKWNRDCSNHWCIRTVTWILTNPTYLGNMIQHKTTRVSYKNHKVLKVPESEWIVKANSHEPIIGQELWDKVQAVNKSVARGRTDNNGNVHALSGLLVCADCGSKLKAKYSWDRNGKVYRFSCRTYTDLGKKYCTSHAITERKIESIVLQDIRSMFTEVTMDEEKSRERFIRNKAKSSEQNRYSDERQLKAIKSRLAELDKLIESAFEEKVFGNLPESVCAKLCSKYQAERECLEKNREEIEKRLAEESKNEEDVDEYIRRLKEYGGCGTLTREMCVQLIDFITVGEKDGQTNCRDIHIYYKLISNESLDDFRKSKK